jgi:hypothetical protein
MGYKIVYSVFSECSQRAASRCKNEKQELESGPFWTIVLLTAYGFPVIPFESSFEWILYRISRAIF